MACTRRIAWAVGPGLRGILTVLLDVCQSSRPSHESTCGPGGATARRAHLHLRHGRPRRPGPRHHRPGPAGARRGFSRRRHGPRRRNVRPVCDRLGADAVRRVADPGRAVRSLRPASDHPDVNRGARAGLHLHGARPEPGMAVRRPRDLRRHIGELRDCRGVHRRRHAGRRAREELRDDRRGVRAGVRAGTGARWRARHDQPAAPVLDIGWAVSDQRRLRRVRAARVPDARAPIRGSSPGPAPTRSARFDSSDLTRSSSASPPSPFCPTLRTKCCRARSCSIRVTATDGTRGQSG